MFAGMFFASLLAATTLPDLLTGRGDSEDEDEDAPPSGEVPARRAGQGLLVPVPPADGAGSARPSPLRPTSNVSGTQEIMDDVQEDPDDTFEFDRDAAQAGTAPPPWLTLQDPVGVAHKGMIFELRPAPGETVIEDFRPGLDRMALHLPSAVTDFELLEGVPSQSGLAQGGEGVQSRISWREEGGGVSMIFSGLDEVPASSIDLLLIDRTSGHSMAPVELAEIIELVETHLIEPAGADLDAGEEGAILRPVAGEMPEDGHSTAGSPGRGAATLAGTAPQAVDSSEREERPEPLAPVSGWGEDFPGPETVAEWPRTASEVEGEEALFGSGAEIVELRPRSSPGPALLPADGSAPEDAPPPRAPGAASLPVMLLAAEPPSSFTLSEPPALEPVQETEPVQDMLPRATPDVILTPEPGEAAEVFWLERGGASLADIHGFRPGEDILRISLDPAQSDPDPVLVLLPAGGGGDVLVLLNGEAMAVLRDAPAAQSTDIHVERRGDLFE